MKRIHTVVPILLLLLAVYLIFIGIIDNWSRFNETLLLLMVAGNIIYLSVEKWRKRKKRLEGEAKTEKQ
jgi:uncharacterized membrane protein